MGRIVHLKHEKTVKALLELFLFEKKAEGRVSRTVRDCRKHFTSFFQKFPFALNTEETLWKPVLAYFVEKMKPATFNFRRVYLRFSLLSL
ncbi:MAG: hypothetical protein ABDK94_01810 [Atribacterota bacterium]